MQKFKLDAGTLKVLKNARQINPGIVIDEGNIIVSRAESGTCALKAVVNTEFPRKFAVTNLAQLLSIFNEKNLDDYEITLGEDRLHIYEVSKKSKIEYFYSPDHLVKTGFPTREIRCVVEFSITGEQLTELKQRADLLALDDFIFKTDMENHKIIVTATNINSSSSNSCSIELGDYTGIAKFNFIVPKDSLNVMPLNYTVAVTDMRLLKFYNTELNIQYYVSSREESEIIEG